MIFPSVFKVHLKGKENELVNRVLEKLEGVDRKEFTRAALVHLALQIVEKENAKRQKELFNGSDEQNNSGHLQEKSEGNSEQETHNPE